MRSIKMIAGAMAATASLYIPSALSAPPVVYSGSALTPPLPSTLSAPLSAVPRMPLGPSEWPPGNQLGWCQA